MRVLIFIFLKCFEISTFVFLPYFLGVALNKWHVWVDTLQFGIVSTSIFRLWWAGWAGIIIIILLVAGLFTIYQAIIGNWALADHLWKKYGR
jgi:hypothetical protein